MAGPSSGHTICISQQPDKGGISLSMKHAKKSRWRFILLGCLATAAALVLAFGILIIVWMQGDSWKQLDLDRLENMKQTIFIYDSQDQPVANLSSQENRVLVPLSQISPYLQQAFIATEDTRFYSHPGIDIKRIFGALWADIKSGSLAQGASTLTQQLVKLTHLSNEKTFTRKIQEAILALQVEQHYTKDEILTLYLNVVYFGNGAYGAEAAAQSYFGKSAADLTCAEAAQLAGIVKAPSTYAPHINMEKSLERRNLILGLMREQGIIDESLYQSALQEEPELKLSRPGQYEYGYYIDAAISEAMERLGMSYEELVSSGYRIYTGLEPWLQQACEEAFADGSLFPADAADGTQVQGAMVFLSSDTGLAAALMGGREYTARRGFDRSTQALRQPGSTIKPLLCFGPAIELKGYSPATPILDEPMDFNGYTPRNASDTYKGWITLRYALSHSVNVPAVQLLQQTGVSLAKSYAEAAGITFDPQDDSLALALGGFTQGVTPLSLAGAYTCFADGGMAHEPALIRRITDSSGKVVYEHTVKDKRVFSEETTFLISDMLTDTVKEGSAQALQSTGIPLACKTGTVAYEKDGVEGVRDIWAAAYNEEYVGVCWMGFDTTDPEHCLPASASGGKYPVPMLARVFAQLYPQGGAPEFTPPSGIVEATVDQAAIEQGQLMLASAYTPAASRLVDYFKRGTEPTATSTYWSFPAAPVITESGIGEAGLPYIRFLQKDPACATYLYRSSDGGHTYQKAAQFDPGHEAIAWEDETAQAGQAYRYYLQSVRLDTGEHPFLGGKTDEISLEPKPPRREGDFFSRFFGW